MSVQQKLDNGEHLLLTEPVKTDKVVLLIDGLTLEEIEDKKKKYQDTMLIEKDSTK